MRYVDLGNIDYVGADIVPELIEKNSVYSGTNRRFEVLDITKSNLPNVDAIFCRDCLVHLPLAMIFDALHNIVSSGATYVLTTHCSFRTVPTNEEIQLGQWRRLNFELAPFYWPPPQRYIVEGCSEVGGQYVDKSISAWPIDQLRLGFSSSV